MVSAENGDPRSRWRCCSRPGLIIRIQPRASTRRTSAVRLQRLRRKRPMIEQVSSVGALRSRAGRSVGALCSRRSQRRRAGAHAPVGQIDARAAGCSVEWRRRAGAGGGEIHVKDAAHRVERHGVAGEGALSHRAAHPLQGGNLLSRVDAGGDHRQRQLAPDDEDRLEQPVAVVLVIGGRRNRRSRSARPAA